MVLARLERESKNFEVAQLAIDEFIAKHPGQSFALKERALIFSEANQWNQAAEAWQTYLESAANPDSESFLTCSEAIQNQNQQSTNPRHALEVIDEGLKLHPHVVSLNQRMASLLIQNGDFERAQKYFIASRKKYPTLRPRLFMEEARIWQSYGWSSHALIAYSNAQKSFDSLSLHKKLMPGFQTLKSC
ncbi:MAG: tetratricopeptide repeat protein, partial [Verrucomicrobia bacterium]|nr:tetratricopeptide repeat protein [Verrucomicrobiota bacterium]